MLLKRWEDKGFHWRKEGTVAISMPPTNKPSATERKSFTSMITVSLIRKLDEAYHDLTGHTFHAMSGFPRINAAAGRYSPRREVR